MATPPAASSLRTPGAQTVHWVIAVLLAFIAGGVWSRGPAAPGSAAFAQNQPLAGARGVYAFTGQIDANRVGLFMLDIEQGTVWCYEIENVNGTRKLKLIAARTWIYDRYLRDFNCSPPDFRMVQELVAQQRAQPADATQPSGEPASPGGMPPKP